MRAWVFNEEMLEPALRRWAEPLGGMFDKDVALATEFIRDFLFSPHTAKLRVADLEPPADCVPETSACLQKGLI